MTPQKTCFQSPETFLQFRTTQEYAKLLSKGYDIAVTTEVEQIACSRRSDSGARVIMKNKASERAGKIFERLEQAIEQINRQ